MKTLKGKTACAGVTVGRIRLLRVRPAVTKHEITDISGETVRFRQALERAVKQLTREKDGADKTAAEILETHIMMLEDEYFTNTVTDLIRDGRINAEYAAFSAGEKLAREFETMDDTYLRARAEDIRQTARRVIDSLTGYEDTIELKEPAILCAAEFTPSVLSTLDKSKVLGLAAEKGSPLSHTALLASGSGLPYLIGIDVAAVRDGENAVLDADGGCLILSPDPETEAKAREKEKAWRQSDRSAPAVPEKTAMRVYANIASAEELETALKHHADGVGLFRTEFLFMNRSAPPDEDEQFQIYRMVLEAMDGKEVLIRTIDAGTDKPVPYLDLPKEENPALGLRGVRVSLRFPDLFRVQLRALLRAACFGNEGIFFPMISSGREIDLIREQITLAAAELDERAEKYRMPRIGIMVETPAAAVISEELGRKVDFLSIGTNDLTQYTLAADRLASGADCYYDERHEAILKLIRMTIDGGHRAGIYVGICGRLGADTELIPRFVRDGLDEVSVSPADIPKVRRSIAEAEKQYDKENKNALADSGICAPADGRPVSMRDIPDPAFSSGLLGPCFGIVPDNGRIMAPVSGTVASAAETGHAVSIRTADGKEILIHAGIDTVTLKGRGFRLAVKPGDTVSRGDTLLEADLDVIRKAGLNPMVITSIMKEKR